MDEAGEMQRSSLEDDEDFSLDDVGDCLDSLEEFQSCDHEGVSEEQIQSLKMELRFLRTFCKCLARDENLKASSKAAVSACLSPFSSPQDESCQLSNALRVCAELRSKVKYFYDQISLTSPSYIPMTNDLLLELVNDLVQNLDDLLSSKAIGVVTLRNQISVLRRSLQFLKNFLDFVAWQCREHENFKNFLAHSEAMAIESARVSYSCLVDQSTEESTFEDEHRISDLLEKIKPSNPELREMYIGVLEATNLSESSHSCTRGELVMGQFLDSLQDLLLEIPNSNPRLKLPALDQLKVLETEFRFIRALLIDPQGTLGLRT